MRLRRRLNLGLAAALVVLVSICGYSLFNIGSLVKADGWVYRTEETRGLVRSTLAALSEAESIERAYVMTGDSTYIESFELAITSVDSHMTALEALEGDSAVGHELLDRAKPQVDARIHFLRTEIMERHEHGQTAAVALMSRDRLQRDSVRHALAALDRAVLMELGPRQERSERQGRRAMLVVLAGTLTATIFAVVLGLFLRRDVLRRQSSEASYRSMIDVLAEGVLVRDTKGVVIECNPSAERILGRPRSEIIGMAPGTVECFTEDGSPMPLDARPGVTASRHTGSAKSEVMGLRRPDGEMRWVLVNAAPMYEPGNGKLLGVTTSFSDITRRREAEANVREHREQLQDFLENAGELIMMANADGRILYANRALGNALGYASPEELQGRLVTSLIDPAGRAAYKARADRLCSGEQVGEFNERFITRDGGHIDVSGNVTCKFENGFPVALRGIFRDMTQINAAQEQLVMAIEQASAANQAKSEFLANMSHELRTPLNSVIGFANVLMRNKAGNIAPQEIQYLQRIHDNGRHLLGLINSILDLSKVEAGRMELELGSVDLGALLSETVAQMEGQVQNRPVALNVAVPSNLRPFTTDAGKLKQVIINLVGNALKFTEFGGVTVRVIGAANGAPLAIEVTDTGIGIPLDRQATVFDAFRQAENSTARRFGGTGLGLTITRSICQLLGYAISLESTPGVGTTFRVALAPAETVTAALPETAHGERVLIIDDDPDARLLLSQYVSDAGCHPVAIGTGAAGLRLAAEERPSLILLDIMMPQMNGYEVLERLRADAELSRIPVVIVSIVATENRRRAIGAAALIDKPVKREEIETVLRQFIAQPANDAALQLGELIRQTIAVPA